ncbi:MAG: SGNH/GDSL hydrolase family protein [Alphaproteobacteria bacterium]|nr:SGNH/GDSL hydrolase family protein [Alphaproteobacteria bacterium]
MSLVEALAPQMLAYSRQFHTDGDMAWAPYVMYFHPKGYRSEVVNTDSYGFRFSNFGGNEYSVGSSTTLPSARLIAGNSVAFGIGASADSATIASRMMAYDTKLEPWLNFGGRAFNSAQELILITLYRHLLPKIDEIVLLSGANNLLLSCLPVRYIQDHGAFYNIGRFYDLLNMKKNGAVDIFSKLKHLARHKRSTHPCNDYTIDKRIRLAVDLTLRHLDGWNVVAKDLGAKLTYVLQPMSGWARDKLCKEEKKLFAELASLARFTTISKEILQQEVCEQYSSMLEAGAKSKKISFINISPMIRTSVKNDQWLFVDHTHLTDDGYDLISRLIIDHIRNDVLSM